MVYYNEIMLRDDEYVEVEGRLYGNPELPIREGSAFIENLRNVQQANNAQISQDTQRLGTDVASSLGGLVGGEGYWTSRYQTPQTNALVADLRATAQAAALNQALENEQAMWKKRYNDAYRAYQRRGSSGGSGGGGGGSNNPDETKGGVDETTEDLVGLGRISLDEKDIAAGGQYIQDFGTNRMIWVTPEGENVTLYRQSDGSYGPNNGSQGQNPWTAPIDVSGIFTNFWQAPARKGTQSTNGGGGW